MKHDAKMILNTATEA